MGGRETKKKGDGKIEKDAEKTGGKAAEVSGDEENGDEERDELERRNEERERERKRVAREWGKMQKKLKATKKEKRKTPSTR